MISTFYRGGDRISVGLRAFQCYRVIQGLWLGFEPKSYCKVHILSTYTALFASISPQQKNEIILYIFFSCNLFFYHSYNMKIFLCHKYTSIASLSIAYVPMYGFIMCYLIICCGIIWAIQQCRRKACGINVRDYLTKNTYFFPEPGQLGERQHWIPTPLFTNVRYRRAIWPPRTSVCSSVNGLTSDRHHHRRPSY